MAGAWASVTRNAAIGGLAAAGMIVVAPSAAHAALGGCSTDIVTERKGTAYCSLVTEGSSFRAKVTCYKITTDRARVIYGPRRTTPTQSAASCLTGEYLGDVVVDRRP